MTATLTEDLLRTPAGPMLAGRVALITGANGGLGRLIARAMAGAGAAVGLVARSAGQLTEARDQIIETGGTAVAVTAVTADVCDRDALSAAFRHVSRSLGPIDVLVNNAGVNGPTGPVWEADPQDWWQTMQVNRSSVLTCTQLALPSMIARRQGRIVNITSQAGAYRWPLPQQPGEPQRRLLRHDPGILPAGPHPAAPQPGRARRTYTKSSQARRPPDSRRRPERHADPVGLPWAGTCGDRPGWSPAWQLTAGTSRPVTESLQRPNGRSSGPANHWGTT